MPEPLGCWYIGTVDGRSPRIREWRIGRMTDSRCPAARASEDAGDLTAPTTCAPSAGNRSSRRSRCSPATGCSTSMQRRCLLASRARERLLDRRVDHSKDMVRLAQEEPARESSSPVEGMLFSDGEVRPPSPASSRSCFPDPVAALCEMPAGSRAGTSCRLARDDDASDAKGTEAVPYLAVDTRGHFHRDDELVALARETSCREARIADHEPGLSFSSRNPGRGRRPTARWRPVRRFPRGSGGSRSRATRSRRSSPRPRSSATASSG